jgi:hypothetical protein
MAEIWGVAVAAVVGAGASAYSTGKAADASKSGANASIAEQARQYDQTRMDFAGQRSIGYGAQGDIASIYGWADPSQAANTERANADRQIGDHMLPAGTTLDPLGKGWFEVHYGGQRVGTLRPGAASGRFINDTGVDINALRQQVTQAQPQTQPGAPDMSRFFTSPDYQFNLEQQQKALERAGAAGGRFNSGRQALELQRNASGNASGEFSNYMNRLFTAAGIGNAATQSTAAAGQNMANNNSAALLGAANNRASLYMQNGANINNAVQGGLQNYMLQQYLKVK